MKHHLVRFALIALVLTTLFAGCSKKAATEDSAPDSKQPTQTGSIMTFNTPDEAVTALAAAAEKHDVPQLGRLFGPGTAELLSSGDDVQDRTAREAFLQRYQAKHQLVAGGSNDLVLQVGEDDWPMPIPLVKDGGRWRFDGAAGADQLVRRRIGGNELRTLDVMHGYVAAQEEYASQSRDGAPEGVYAQRLRSEPGKHNGLYWETRTGEPESPAGPFLAAAASEGYAGGQGTSKPYHGYLYRQLISQGASATGGAKNYIVDGKLSQGFALIAYPAEYGVSGIMTFIVNQDDLVWQRDLGEDTAKLASEIQTFNPDSSWTPVPPED